MRPSEYGRILLEIAAGGPERPSRWAAALGMAGPAGSLKRRLIAMKTTQPPSRRRLLSWAFALLAVGAAGSSPGGSFPARRSPRAGPRRPHLAASRSRPRRGGQGPTQARGGPPLRAARLGLAEADIEEAESNARAQAARLEYRRKQRDRIDQLVHRVRSKNICSMKGRPGCAGAGRGARAELRIAVARATAKPSRRPFARPRLSRDIARAGSGIPQISRPSTSWKPPGRRAEA